MIDISEKQNVLRSAVASGEIVLKTATIKEIENDNIKKGNVFETAKIAGITAVKKTSELIPYCHQVPIDAINFTFKVNGNRIIVKCSVKANYKTGVEMEALIGVNLALLTIWDMVKYLEKDESGNYPITSIKDIEVVEKIKG
jgi:cyclic pyranopterin phosphate synthase